MGTAKSAWLRRARPGARAATALRSMRSLAVLAACAVLASAPAHAGPRRTLEAVALRKRPGEKEPVVARLAAGAEVTVLAIEGRWLRVRSGGVEGYLTRTTVSAPDPAEEAPGGPWSAARKVGGRVVGDLYIAVVATTAALRTQPRPHAAQLLALPRGARPTV